MELLRNENAELEVRVERGGVGHSGFRATPLECAGPGETYCDPRGFGAQRWEHTGEGKG